MARRRNRSGLPRDPRTRLIILVMALVFGAVANWWRQRQEPVPADPTGPTGRVSQQSRRQNNGTTPRASSSAAVPPGPPAAPPQQVGVAAIGTFNIEWFGSSNTKPRTDTDVERIAAVVKATDAALLGLQEIGDEETMDRLLQHLPPGYQYVLGTSGRGQRVGMLWDSRRASVGRAAEWPDINRGLERYDGTLRAPLVAPARVGNFDFLFVVVHLKALGDDRAVRMRRTQAQRLRARLDDYLAGQADKDVIVVGDFNDVPGSQPLAELTARGKTGFVSADARLPDRATTYLGRTSRLDHIVVASPAVSQEEWTGKVFIYPKPRGAERKQYEKSVSDHLPTWATFDVSRDHDP